MDGRPVRTAKSKNFSWEHRNHSKSLVVLSIRCKLVVTLVQYPDNNNLLQICNNKYPSKFVCWVQGVVSL